MTDPYPPDSLRAHLAYEPHELAFGTSGRRGELVHLTQLEIYINALAELEYLQSLPRTRGGIVKGEEFYYAFDLRPSSTRFDPDQQGRGEMTQAIERAIRDAGMLPVNLGPIPTPALTHFALQRGRGSIMITGSHIPFDRNGYKTNSTKGELLKEDEGPINERCRAVRERFYRQAYEASPFDARGSFRSGHRELQPRCGEAKADYIDRYIRFFSGHSLGGKSLLAYQHSAVGRDILVEVLERLGARVIPAGRSETFVPIDTENIDGEQLAAIQALVDRSAGDQGPLFAVVSTDGDSDRPLVLGVDPQTSRVRFYSGDLVGMIVAEYLHADAAIVPISCNDAIDRGPLKDIVQPKTRIGSPYVVAGMAAARCRGAQVVCGWEPNGGFLLGSDVARHGRILAALPTRDALLPILCVLYSAQENGLSLNDLFARLPARFSGAALLKRFPRARGLEIVERFSPADRAIRAVVFESARIRILDAQREEVPASGEHTRNIEKIRFGLEQFFTLAQGFGRVACLDFTDGVRVLFSNGDVAHFRPSGNADELRIYAVADTRARADEIVRLGVAETDGILRRMERAVTST